MLYSAAHIMLVPSKIEIFGQVGLEANACGTPCIIFENTGATDYVKHKFNGYVAKYLDINDYANGINWILTDEERYKKLSTNASENAKKNFDDKIISEKVLKSYQNLIK